MSKTKTTTKETKPKVAGRSRRGNSGNNGRCYEASRGAYLNGLSKAIRSLGVVKSRETATASAETISVPPCEVTL